MRRRRNAPLPWQEHPVVVLLGAAWQGLRGLRCPAGPAAPPVARSVPLRSVAEPLARRPQLPRQRAQATARTQARRITELEIALRQLRTCAVALTAVAPNCGEAADVLIAGAAADSLLEETFNYAG